jgi:hypothetical protein
MNALRTALARQLRRWAQRLAPVLTDEQIRDLRDHYDNHDAVTGEPIRRHGDVHIHPSGNPSYGDPTRRPGFGLHAAGLPGLHGDLTDWLAP